MPEQISIGEVGYWSYANVNEADEYLNATISATVWRAETDEEQKARALISATRWIDTLEFIGEKSQPDQALQWPRTGIEGVDEYIEPIEVDYATIELANMLLIDPALQTTLSTVGISETKRLKAGSVEIEYFRGSTTLSSNLVTLLPFPKSILDILRPYLSGQLFAGGFGLAQAFGTCWGSYRDPTYGFTNPI